MWKLHALSLILFSTALGFTQELPLQSRFKNRFGVGLDGVVRYDRLLPHGFQIGTEWKYAMVIEGDPLPHMDQQPEIYSLNLAHCWYGKWIGWENRLRPFSGTLDLWGVSFSSTLRKSFEFDERWSIAPSIRIFDFQVNPMDFDEDWPSRRTAFHGEFRTQLGVDLEVYF